MMTNAITDWMLVLAPIDTFVASSQKNMELSILLSFLDNS